MVVVQGIKTIHPGGGILDRILLIGKQFGAS